MEPNLQMEDANGVGSEQVSDSEDGQYVVALIRKIMATKEFEWMINQQVEAVIRSMMGDVVRMMEDLVGKVVKEQFQSAFAKQILASGSGVTNTNASAMSSGRNLKLKFLDDVSNDVLTGKEIKGKGGTPMMVAIVDAVTGQVIESGLGSSAKVEILLLEASENDNEWSHQEFDSRIIKESDKTKPHFAKSCSVNLEKGTGVLTNAKLAQDSNWTKSCKCRLAARVHLNGIKVQEAWTEPFVVSDNRSKLYKKDQTPSISDPVWRLKQIGTRGARRENLSKYGIRTVGDFLFSHSVDPRRLQKIIGVCIKAWNEIVDHAQTCIINDTRIGVYNEGNMGVVFDVVGGLKGMIRDSNYVANNDLSKDEKDCTQKLLLSAFNNREQVRYFLDETTFLLHHFPSQANPGCQPTISASINYSDSTDPGISSQGISPSIRPLGNVNSTFEIDSLVMAKNREKGVSNIPDGTSLLHHSPSQANPGCQSTIPESINNCDSIDPGTSCQGISPSIRPLGNANGTFEIDSLLTAKNRGKGVSCIPDETTPLPQHFPSQANPGCQPTIPESINHCDSTDPGTSAQGISPSISPSGKAISTCEIDSLAMASMRRLDTPSPLDYYYYIGWHEDFELNQNLTSLLCSEGCNLSGTLGHAPQSRQQSNANNIRLLRAVFVMLWTMFRARKRVLALGQGDAHVSKRQKL